MYQTEKRIEFLESKLTAMQSIIDSGFPIWYNDVTKSLFMEKYERRKVELNKLYQGVLSCDD